jgi:hypothetical protein
MFLCHIRGASRWRVLSNKSCLENDHPSDHKTCIKQGIRCSFSDQPEPTPLRKSLSHRFMFSRPRCAGDRLGTRDLLYGESCIWYNDVRNSLSRKSRIPLEKFSDRKSTVTAPFIDQTNGGGVLAVYRVFPGASGSSLLVRPSPAQTAYTSSA